MTEKDPAARAAQDTLYTQVVAEYGPALGRLAVATERDPTAQRDLLQEVHVAVSRSLAVYQRQCSLRTWIYRLAHNAAATHVKKSIRHQLVTSMADAFLDMRRCSVVRHPIDPCPQ